MVTTDLLLLLLALQVAGQEPSQEFCDGFCSHDVRAREMEQCKMCPEQEVKTASLTERRGDIGEEGEDDYYDYDYQIVREHLQYKH